MSQRGDGQLGVALPHDLVARLRIVLPAPLAPQVRYQAGRRPEAVRGGIAMLAGPVAEEFQLFGCEHQVRLAVRQLTPQQRQHHC